MVHFQPEGRKDSYSEDNNHVILPPSNFTGDHPTTEEANHGESHVLFPDGPLDATRDGVSKGEFPPGKESYAAVRNDEHGFPSGIRRQNHESAERPLAVADDGDTVKVTAPPRELALVVAVGDVPTMRSHTSFAADQPSPADGKADASPGTDSLAERQDSSVAAGEKRNSLLAISVVHSGFLDKDSEATVTTEPTRASFPRSNASTELLAFGKPFSSTLLDSGESGSSADGTIKAQGTGLFGSSLVSDTDHAAENGKKVVERKSSVEGEEFTWLETFLADHSAMVFPQFSDEELESSISFLPDGSLQATDINSTDLQALKRNGRVSDLQNNQILPLKERNQLSESQSGRSLSLKSAENQQLLGLLKRNIMSLDTAAGVLLSALRSAEMGTFV